MSTEHKNIFLGLIGGLGDIIYGYRNSKEWGSLTQFKENNHSSVVKAIIVSHNPSARSIVDLNPYIDIVECHSPKREMRDLGWTHRQVIEQYSNKFEPIKISNYNIQQKIYLSKYERNYVLSLMDEKTVIFHPFASEQARKLDTSVSLRIVDRLLNNNLRVIVIGSSYTKSFGIEEQYNKIEVFPHIRNKNFVNLIDKANPRVCIGMITMANLFVGSWSCYGVSAWLHGRRSIIIVPKRRLDGCKKIHDRKYPMHSKEDIVTTPEEIMRKI